MKIKHVLLPFLALILVAGSASAQNILTLVRVQTVPDNYGPETPDIFFILKDGTNVLHTSTTIEQDPPINWVMNLVLDSTKNYTIEVWDDDAPITANDDLGTVTIPGSGSGTVIGTVGGASGQLELFYEYTVVTAKEEGVTGLKDLKIFPNPSAGKFMVELEVLELRQCRMEVVNVEGKRVFMKEMLLEPGKMRETVDLQEIASGTYKLILSSGKEVVSRNLQILQ